MPSSLFLLTTYLDDSLLPNIHARELTDRIRTMRKQEVTHHQCADYMRDSDSYLSTASQIVDEESRIKMCEWCYQVVDFCKFRRETVGIGMSYLDRYISTRQGRLALTDRKFYQLAAMTSLYMAIKIHEPLEMETSLLADLSRGVYTGTFGPSCVGTEKESISNSSSSSTLFTQICKLRKWNVKSWTPWNGVLLDRRHWRLYSTLWLC